MSLLAYLGDAALRQRTIERLRELEQAGNWVARPLYWDGAAGSLVGSLLESDDLGRWESELGLPKWLALAVDGMMARSPDVQQGVRCGVGLLECIQVGARMELAGNRCIIALLQGERYGLDKLPIPSNVRRSLDAVVFLHAKRLRGETVEREQWRQARRMAVALTNEQTPESISSAVSSCIEAAAWDPAESRSAVSDVLRSWMAANAVVALQEYPWTKADDARTHELCEQLYAEAKAAASDSDAAINVMQLMAQKHPEWAERMKAASQHRSEQFVAQWHHAAQVLKEVLEKVAPEVPATLIPRAHLFANPARAGISISPDGHWLAWLADSEGVMNVWAAPKDQPEQARQVTFDKHRGIQAFSWTYRPGFILYSCDQDGDENWRLHGADLVTGSVRELTPAKQGVTTVVFSVSRERRDEIVVAMNARDARFPDLHLLNLDSSEMTLLQENSGFAAFLLDDQYKVRLASRNTADGGSELLRADARGGWHTWMSISPDDARGSYPSHFSSDGRTLYFYDSRGRDTAALTAIDLDSGEAVVLAQDPRADIGATLTDQVDYRPLAYGVTYERYALHAIDASIRRDLDFLDSQGFGEWRVGRRTEDDRLWIIHASSDVRPSVSWLYDRDAFTLTKLLELRPQLAGVQLARMQPVVITSRDGMSLVSYLTVPREADAGALRTYAPQPLVLLVHGGPWSRDHFGYNSTHQWLANRGYAVLSVNFRGSTGFGKAFVNAANGEWGRKMDEDLEDAVQWAIDCGIADPGRLAIYGGSYGGYAVLSAMTRYPERYACGIDLVGPSNLVTLLASIPPYWEAERVRQYRAMGNPSTDTGLALLRERSPLHRAGQIRAPLLIAQGANDPRVKQAESEQMVNALRSKGIAVTYALYPDEGHGFVRAANRLSFTALCERFLARHLGGREEAWTLEDFPGTTIQLTEAAHASGQEWA